MARACRCCVLTSSLACALAASRCSRPSSTVADAGAAPVASFLPPPSATPRSAENPSHDAATPWDLLGKAYAGSDELDNGPPAAPNETSNNELFNFEILTATRCHPPISTDAGDTVTLGLRVRVVGKTERFFVSPRDVKLTHAGAIVSATLDDAGARCEPRLKPTQVARGHQASGFVVFDVPVKLVDQLEVTYHPTRWGGAPAVQVPLPKMTDR